MADSSGGAFMIGVANRGWRPNGNANPYAIRSQPGGNAMVVGVDPAVQDAATNMDLKVQQLIQHAQQQQNGTRANMAPMYRQGGPVGTAAAKDGKPTTGNGIGKWIDNLFSRRTAMGDVDNSAVSYHRTDSITGGMDGSQRMSTVNSNNGYISSLSEAHSSSAEDMGEQRIRWLKRIVQNRYFIAVATGIIVIILLTMLNPPFVQKRSKNKLYRSTQDGRKIFILGGIAMVTTLVVPMFLDRPKK